MSLIKCPVCGKEISSNAISCPHCGEPLKLETSLYAVLLKEQGTSYISLLKVIREITNCDLDTAESFVKSIPVVIISDINKEQAECYTNKLLSAGAQAETINSNNTSQYSNIIKCPNCNSPSVKKISTGSKAVSVAMWGIFAAGKLTKTYQCNKCGYRW